MTTTASVICCTPQKIKDRSAGGAEVAAKSGFFMATVQTVELPHFATLLVEVAQSLCLITFNRPKKLNALSTELLQDIIRLSHWLYTRDEIRVVIIAGAGRMFSSGFDLGNLKSATVGELPRASADLGRLAAEALTNVPQLTIAAVHGHCVGGGGRLGRSMRLAYCHTRCNFCYS